MKKQNGIKNTIVVLSVLLAFFVVALVVLYVYLKSISPKNTVATAQYNEITQSETASINENNDSVLSAESGTSTAVKSENSQSGNVSHTSDSTQLSLYNKHPEDNIAFSANNMLPGDSVKKYYNVKVSYREAVTVHFGTDIKKDDCLGDVLKVRVRLHGSDSVLYDGLLRDVPNSLDVTLGTPKEVSQTVLCYEITAYLDTSVGNKYANKALVADFNWWVDDTGSLGAAPATGDIANITVWFIVLAISAVLVIGLYAYYKANGGMRNE